MNLWREFHGPNAGFVLELYDRFRQRPDAADMATRTFLLSYDHRMVDGREAVQFLARVKGLVEHPEDLLLEA